MGFVYILKNPSFGDEWVKIGQTENIETRVETLNRSEATPFAFRVYATYEVKDAQMVERQIHEIMDELHYDLRARETLNGRDRVREFFHISAERVYKFFEHIAVLRGDGDNLRRYPPNNEEMVEEEHAEILSYRQRASNTTFEKLGISPGTELIFLYDDAYSCQTYDEKNKIKYNDEIYSISAFARKIGSENFQWTGSSVNGFRYFTFEDETLWNRRKRLEKICIEESEENEDMEISES